MKKCLKCGVETENNSGICRECEEKAGTERKSADKKNNPAKARNIIIISLICVLVFFALAQVSYLIVKKKVKNYINNFFKPEKIEVVIKEAGEKYEETLKDFEKRLSESKKEAEEAYANLSGEIKNKVFENDNEALLWFKDKYRGLEAKAAAQKLAPEEERQLEAYGASIKYYSLKISKEAFVKIAGGVKDAGKNVQSLLY